MEGVKGKVVWAWVGSMGCAVCPVPEPVPGLA